MSVSRFGVSVDTGLLRKFDRKIKERGYGSRSEAFRDLIRESFLKEDIQKGTSVMVGTVTIVYNHHEMELPQSLTEEQHKHHSFVLSSVHVHLDPHNCMEVILLKGKGKQISEFANRLISRKGVKYGKMTLAEKDF